MHRTCSFKRKLRSFCEAGNSRSCHFGWYVAPTLGSNRHKNSELCLWTCSQATASFSIHFFANGRPFCDAANAVFNMHINSDCFLTVLCLCLRFRVKNKQFSIDWLIGWFKTPFYASWKVLKSCGFFSSNFQALESSGKWVWIVKVRWTLPFFKVVENMLYEVLIDHRTLIDSLLHK